MKRFLAVLLAALMLLSSLGALTVFAEDDKVCNCEHTPLIYVYGRQNIYDDPSAEGRTIISGYDVDWLKSMVKDGVKLYAKGLLSGKFDAFCDYMGEQFEEKYKDFACDADGNLPDNASGVEWTWSPETMADDHMYDNVYSYGFIYDARKDPFDVADELNDYIECVRRVTGHRRVAILSRCMGSEMAIAYFEKYGWEDIDTFFTYSSAALGTTIFSELFSGKVEIDLNSINNYLKEKNGYIDPEEEPFADPDAEQGNSGMLDPQTKVLLFTFLELMQHLKALGLPSKLCNLLLGKVRAEVIPRVLKASFATSPGYWSMVAPQDYADAKAFLFKNDADKYAKLIEKIDAYDARVRRPMQKILTQMKDDGVKLCFLVKYGFQLIPVTESQHEQSDDKITMAAQSFGATGAKYRQTLSDKYIAAREKEGFGKYISPDKIIDASTAWFPDLTWYVKNIRHNDFPGRIYDFVVRLVRSDHQLTVEDDPEFPQFMSHYWKDGEELWEPMNEENMDTEFSHPGFKSAVKEFFKALKVWLKKKLNIKSSD